MVDDIFITKYPYLFWGMKQERAYVDLEKCTLKSIKELKEGEERTIYKFRKFDKWKFLIVKYMPILVFFFIIFNRYDFLITGNKLLEYLVSLGFTLVIFYTRRLYTYTAFALIVLTGFFWIESVPFLVKYTLTFVCIFSFIFDLDRTVYSILNSNYKTVANFYIIEKGINNE